MNTTTYLTVAEAAQRLGVHRNTVRNWVKKGLLPSAKLPGARAHRFDVRDVDRLLRQRGAAVSSVSPDRISVGPQLVTASQISEWARVSGRNAQETLPRLMRRLMLASGHIGIRSLPAGDGVISDGWDGVVEVHESRFLPTGVVGLEIGTDADVKKKANKDYRKRLEDPLALKPSDTSYVFVTPRRWKQRAAWVSAKTKEAHWREVRVLDADSLEAWLESTPAVHIWLSEQLGRRPRDAQTLGAWWEAFRTKTDPPLPLDLFVAGRDEAAQNVRKFVAGPAGVLTVQSEWSDDVLAFLYGALAGQDGQAEKDIAPVVVVDQEQVWDDIVAQPGRVILVPRFEGASIAAAQAAGHHVILPATAEELLDSPSISLPKPSRRGATDAFQNAGVAFEDAGALAALARRSLPSLLRQRARDPRRARPKWSEGSDASLVAALALLGSWTQTDGDQSTVTAITNKAWTDVEARLLAWNAGTDRPFVLSADQWHVASAEDALRLVGRQLSPAVLTRWHETARAVLLEVNPLDSLDEDARLAAQARGIGRTYSSTLRTGIGRGVALLGSLHGLKFSDGRTATDHADRFVAALLHGAPADEPLNPWLVLADVLPLLAEASPHRFLDALDYYLDSHPEAIRALFRDGEGTTWLSSWSPHSHLLWALETLAWEDDHLIDATRLLARLDALDVPRGRNLNRPHHSISEILVLWVRHTGASLSTRQQALEAVVQVSDELGWEVVQSLWPSTHATSSPPASPRFRDARPDSQRVSVADWLGLVGHLVEVAVRLAERDPLRWADLIPRIGALPPSELEVVLAAFAEAADRGPWSSDQRLRLWQQMRETVSRHREFHDAEWAMPPDVIDRIDAFTARFAPAREAERRAFLFDWRPRNITTNRYDVAAYNRELERLRVEAVEAVVSEEGVPGLQRLAELSPQPRFVGLAAGSISIDELEPVALGWLTSEERPLREFAHWWSRVRAQHGDVEWLSTTLRSAHVATVEAKAALALNAPATRATWEVLGGHSPEALDLYWNEAQPFQVAPADLPIALNALVDHGRPLAAVDLASHDVHAPANEEKGLTPELAYFALESLRTAAALDPQPPAQVNFAVGALLDYLAEHEGTDERVAALEFAFVPILEHDRRPAALERLLSREPAVYVSLICNVYKPRTGGEDITDAKRDLARQSWSVLHDWGHLPGAREDGTVDGEHLVDWVRQVRLQLTDADRGDIGDEQVGQVLSSSPAGDDGVWPHPVVRDLIETIGNHQIESGFVTGKLNSRGVVSRALYAGGNQERALAADFRSWAAAVRVKHPRTARLLRQLAEAYEADARHEDARAELDQDTD